MKAIEAQRHAEQKAASVKAQPDPKPIVPEAPKAEAPKADTGKPKEDSEEMQEIPIAGRTKMTVPKNKDYVPIKEKEQAPESDDHAEAKDELNAILKRAPGMSILSMPYCLVMLIVFLFIQSLSSRNLTVLLAQKPSPSCSRNIQLFRSRMWLSSTTTNWDGHSRAS